MISKILTLGVAVVVILSVVMACECLAELNSGVVNQAVASMVNPK